MAVGDPIFFERRARTRAGTLVIGVAALVAAVVLLTEDSAPGWVGKVLLVLMVIISGQHLRGAWRWNERDELAPGARPGSAPAPAPAERTAPTTPAR